jgi:hypothetical protein
VSPHQRQGFPPYPLITHRIAIRKREERIIRWLQSPESKQTALLLLLPSFTVLDPRPSRNHLIMNNGPIYTERTAFPLLLPPKSFFRLYKT